MSQLSAGSPMHSYIVLQHKGGAPHFIDKRKRVYAMRSLYDWFLDAWLGVPLWVGLPIVEAEGCIHVLRVTRKDSCSQVQRGQWAFLFTPVLVQSSLQPSPPCIWSVWNMCMAEDLPKLCKSSSLYFIMSEISTKKCPPPQTCITPLSVQITSINALLRAPFQLNGDR